MMKRLIALSLSALLLMAGCTFAETVTEPATEDYQPEYEPEQNTEAYQLETKSFPWYAAFIMNKLEGEMAIPLWFVNGVDDLPYMDLQDWANFMIFCMTHVLQMDGYELEVEIDETAGWLDRKSVV